MLLFYLTTFWLLPGFSWRTNIKLWIPLRPCHLIILLVFVSLFCYTTLLPLIWCSGGDILIGWFWYVSPFSYTTLFVSPKLMLLFSTDLNSDMLFERLFPNMRLYLMEITFLAHEKRKFQIFYARKVLQSTTLIKRLLKLFGTSCFKFSFFTVVPALIGISIGSTKASWCVIINCSRDHTRPVVVCLY